jgi:hypothetical protein
MAIMYDTEVIDQALALKGFQQLMEDAVSEGVLNRRCEICDTAIDFRWEDAKTNFTSIEEAKPMMERLEAENIASRAHIVALRRALKN